MGELPQHPAGELSALRAGDMGIIPGFFLSRRTTKFKIDTLKAGLPGPCLAGSALGLECAVSVCCGLVG